MLDYATSWLFCYGFGSFAGSLGVLISEIRVFLGSMRQIPTNRKEAKVAKTKESKREARDKPSTKKKKMKLANAEKGNEDTKKEIRYEMKT